MSTTSQDVLTDHGRTEERLDALRCGRSPVDDVRCNVLQAESVLALRQVEPLGDTPLRSWLARDSVPSTAGHSHLVVSMTGAEVLAAPSLDV